MAEDKLPEGAEKPREINTEGYRRLLEKIEQPSPRNLYGYISLLSNVMSIGDNSPTYMTPPLRAELLQKQTLFDTIISDPLKLQVAVEELDKALDRLRDIRSFGKFKNEQFFDIPTKYRLQGRKAAEVLTLRYALRSREGTYGTRSGISNKLELPDSIVPKLLACGRFFLKKDLTNNPIYGLSPADLYAGITDY